MRQRAVEELRGWENMAKSQRFKERRPPKLTMSILLQSRAFLVKWERCGSKRGGRPNCLFSLLFFFFSTLTSLPFIFCEITENKCSQKD